MHEQPQKVTEILQVINQALLEDELLDYLEIHGLDLSFSDLSGLRAECIMAHSTDLRAAALFTVSFRHCEFDTATLESCNLEEADIADCAFSAANPRKAQM